MKKHFFLEGPIREGKSTLIRNLIRDHLQQIGGFSSQRLLNDSGETVGFRITSVAEAMELTAKYSRDLSDVFLFFDGEKTEIKAEVFTDTAVKLLRESTGKKLILLDEVGGIELLEPEFRQELYRILEEDIPCLGVLKLEICNRHMCDNACINSDCTSYLIQLKRDMVSRLDADVIRFERKNAKEAEKALKAFIEPLFRQI